MLHSQPYTIVQSGNIIHAISPAANHNARLDDLAPQLALPAAIQPLPPKSILISTCSEQLSEGNPFLKLRSTPASPSRPAQSARHASRQALHALVATCGIRVPGAGIVGPRWSRVGSEFGGLIGCVCIADGDASGAADWGMPFVGF